MSRRVLLLVTDLLIGGTPTVVRELSLRLHACGADVQVACLASWGPTADLIAAGGVAVSALGATGSGDLAVIGRLRKLIGEQRIDVVLSFLVHANVAAAAARWRGGSFELIQSIQTTQRKPRWHWLVQAVAHHAASRVVVPSPSVAEMGNRRSLIPMEKFVVIPNAVDLAQMHPIGRPPHAGAFRVGFLGRLDPVKRIPDLIEAMAGLDNRFTLDIYGTGRHEQAVRDGIDRWSLQGRVGLHGVMPAAAVLSRIDLLVLPSEAEGFGLVLIEAMAAGVPVVGTDAPGIRDVVEHGINGLLVPIGRPAKLAEAIRQVADDSSLRDRLVAGGRQAVAERYTWDRVLPAYQALLHV